MKEPLKDRKLAEAILDAIIDAGLSDKGANGALSRVGRLPVAVNGKYDFDCQLVDWHPERRYTVEEFVEGLQIDLQKKSKTSTKSKASHGPCPHNKTPFANASHSFLYVIPSQPQIG